MKNNRKKYIWAVLLHIYQPPDWDLKVIRKVACESYRPILALLKSNPKVHLSLNICGSLTEQLARYSEFKDIINDTRNLAQKEQIEFTGSAKYHTLLPKLPSEEIIRQIKLNNQTNKKVFGPVWNPKGFFLPEMAFTPRLLPILKKQGYKWIALDEICHSGTVGKIFFDQKYKTKSGLFVIFRDRVICDIFLGYPTRTAKDFLEAIKRTNRSYPYSIIALDGETIGHHRPELTQYFKYCVLQPEITTITYSELLTRYQRVKIIAPMAGSWASFAEFMAKKIPYELWDDPDNPIHQTQWELYYYVLDTCRKLKNKPGYNKARLRLDQCLNSDPFWWASVRPWWSVEIINDGADRLMSVLKLFAGIDPKILSRANQLANHVKSKTRAWQDSGQAAKMKKAFLKQVNARLHLGGERVK